MVQKIRGTGQFVYSESLGHGINLVSVCVICTVAVIGVGKMCKMNWKKRCFEPKQNKGGNIDVMVVVAKQNKRTNQIQIEFRNWSVACWNGVSDLFERKKKTVDRYNNSIAADQLFTNEKRKINETVFVHVAHKEKK